MFVLIKMVFYYCCIHFFIFLSALMVKQKPLKYLGMLMAISSFGFRWMTSHGFSALDHSKANVQVCGIIFLFMSSFSIWIYLAYKSYKKSAGCLVGYFTFWVLFWISLYYARVARSCDHLQDSLHPDVKYSEEGGECKWVKGKVCWDYTIEGAFKPLFWGHTECSQQEDNLTMHRK